MVIEREEVRNLMHKYEQKLQSELGPGHIVEPEPITSREYQLFKKQYMAKHMTVYEKACNISEKILKIKPDAKREKKLSESIKITHLDVTPTGVVSFSILAPTTFILLGLFLSVLLPTITGGEISLFFILFFVITGFILITPFNRLPDFMADNWRMRASNQMVQCIFYVVTYMRHTSNLELAIEFAADRLAPPLSLDLKKVVWDVETEKFESIKESLESYLETWKRYNLEFIEAFHLIESSLFEGTEDKRIATLDKSLSVMLDETYEKMLHYAQNLKSPLTMLHMLGIILPILGLVILPLIVSFMEGVKWYHISMLYNVILPISVFYLAKTILSKRPTGYGSADITEENPELKKYRKMNIRLGALQLSINPFFLGVAIFFIMILIALSPLMLHIINPSWDVAFLKSERGLHVIDATNFQAAADVKYDFLGYREPLKGGAPIGPFGLGASLLSLAFPLAFGLSIGLYYTIRSKNVIKIREDAKNLEKEFASALFQLGNRLGDGLPAELAFGKVAKVMEGTMSGKFFSLVESNIRRLGVGVEKAIFDRDIGALTQFPSNLIESTMKVLTESVKKGPRIAAQAILSVSRYIKEIHKVEERLKDLLADIIADMKSQINFLTPAIAGIVIGITSMVTTIIGRLGSNLRQVQQQAVTAGTAAPGGGLLELFGDGIPAYYFQIIVGLYVVQILFILTIMSNGIENGSDKLNEEYLIGKNLVKGTLLYTFIAGTVILVFNLIAVTILVK